MSPHIYTYFLVLKEYEPKVIGHVGSNVYYEFQFLKLRALINVVIYVTFDFNIFEGQGECDDLGHVCGGCCKFVVQRQVCNRLCLRPSWQGKYSHTSLCNS